MAARWGAGEETLTACAMDFFPMDTLEETSGCSSEETLEAFQSCLDPSIISIFEDTPTIEAKGLDAESEATLLTALTEILDNVDEENLSPFDTLPDADLLSGQKGREQSPLRRMLCLSRSPPEKDVRSSARILSNGKNLPRKQANSLQRSDGEEEEDGSLNLSPAGHNLCPDNELLDWEGLSLPLPVSFGHEGEDGVSVSLGDLVRHMHPYCMAISVENEVGEQMLPEGGIVLEVIDQGENGEPILAIPNLSFSPPPMERSSENEKKLSVDTEDAADDTSEDIVVVDDDEDLIVSVGPVKIAAPQTTSLSSHMKDERNNNRQMENIRAESSSRKKKKKKSKRQSQSNPVEGRVLRSATKGAQELAKKPEVMSVKEKKYKAPKTPVASTSSPPGLKETLSSQTKTQSETTTTTVLPEINVVVASQSPRQDTIPLADEKSSTTEVSPQQPSGILKRSVSVGPTAALSVVQSTLSSASPAVCPNSEVIQKTPPVNEVLPPVVPAVPEPKPKSLSLEQYRKLRQQKKPVPMEKRDANSIKWPSLPELPKELPPIPCLPDPSPKDPRRFNPPTGKNEAEVKPAWQPRGPGAPPTPEALLAPPAYMVASASRVSASNPTSKPQQAPDPSRLPQQPLTPPSKLVNNSATDRPTTAQPAVLCAPQTSGRSDILATQQLMSSAERKSTPRLAAENGRIDEIRRSQPGSLVSTECTKTSIKTTTDVIKPVTICGTPMTVPQKINVVSHSVPEVTASASLHKPVAPESKSSKPNTIATPLFSSESRSHSQKATSKLVALKSQKKPTTTVIPQTAKSSTQELIEAFTAEIGIEAADLTSLLEQFEETQAKEEQCVPEVSGRAAAVGNSSVELVPEKSVVERVRANGLSSTAAMTPPATPPHQMWKPLVPVALLGKNKLAETTKSNSSKVIQIEARPLPSVKTRSKPTFNSMPVDPAVACLDHDYCLPNNGIGPGEPGKRGNVKEQSYITIKPIKPQATTTTETTPAVPAVSLQSTSKPNNSPQKQPVEGKSNDEMEKSSVLETPDASPTRLETESTCKNRSPRGGHFGRSYRRHTSSRSSSPAESPKERIGGRSRKRRAHHSPSPMSSYSESESHSSRSRSRSFSPAKKRYRRRRSESSGSSSSSSCSSSLSRCSVSRSPPRKRRYSYSSSRSGSWSRSRSRSRSPQRRAQWNRSRQLYSPTFRSYYSQGPQANVEEVKIRKEKAIEERRVVYVGRIRGTMTQKELKERFSYFGEIEECTLHFRDHGDNYGFVTYYDTKDAFTAIENGSRLRKPDELPFDLCFGGRRQFCQTSYADLDSNREYDTLPSKGKFHALDFDTLLKQAQQNLKR